MPEDARDRALSAGLLAAGVLCAFVGMVAGSLLPQWLTNNHTPHRPLATEPA